MIEELVIFLVLALIAVFLWLMYLVQR